MILVTGGTGLVGSHLLYKLVKNGDSVRAIYRNKESLSKVKQVFGYYDELALSLFESINWVQADLLDVPKLQEAFVGVTHVYHCAALVSFDPSKYYELRKVNIEGTANIVNLAIAYKVVKLCYVSSIATLGHYDDEHRLINESTEYNSEADNSVYAITKYGAELEVWRAAQEGLDVVVVNPGVIIGPGFWNGNSSGQLFKTIQDGLSFYTYGVVGYVDVCDVVEVMIKLMTNPIVNERYILVSENIDFKTLQDSIAMSLGVKSASKLAQSWFLHLIWRLDWLKCKCFGTRRQFTKHNAQSALRISRYDNYKVKEVLGFTFVSIKESIARTCQFYLKDMMNSKY